MDMTENDQEHKAFEALGKDMGLDMSMHPLHLLYLNPLTDKYLDIFKAGYAANVEIEAERPWLMFEDVTPSEHGVTLEVCDVIGGNVITATYCCDEFEHWLLVGIVQHIAKYWRLPV
jgi:hypothetical protein